MGVVVGLGLTCGGIAFVIHGLSMPMEAPPCDPVLSQVDLSPGSTARISAKVRPGVAYNVGLQFPYDVDVVGPLVRGDWCDYAGPPGIAGELKLAVGGEESRSYLIGDSDLGGSVSQENSRLYVAEVVVRGEDVSASFCVTSADPGLREVSCCLFLAPAMDFQASYLMNRPILLGLGGTLASVGIALLCGLWVWRAGQRRTAS